jgi:hypothetical protein
MLRTLIHWAGHNHLLPWVLFAQFGFDFGGLLGFLEGILQGILDAIIQVFQFIWNVLVYVAQYIWAGLNFVAHFFYQLALDIKNAFKWLWDNIVKRALVKALEVFVKVRQWLQKVFGPVIRFLHRLRAWYDFYFRKWVVPILRILRQIRQTLQIFRLLGFKWAARLDARLAGIENKIVQAYELIRQNLNRVISWIDLIVDPTFLLRRSPLFGAIIRSAPELRNLMLQTVTTPLTPDQQTAQDAARGRYTLSTYKQRQQDSYSQGNLPADTQASLDQFRAKASAYLGT